MTTVPSGIWPIDPNVTTGTDLATYLNTWMNAFQSMQASATRPPLITKGGVWAKTIGATDVALMFYDGTADYEIGSVIGGNVAFGGTTASTTPPASPSEGDTWVDTSSAGAPILKVYNGTTWGAAGGGMFKGNNGTIGTAAGDIFRVNEKTLNQNTTIDADENASAAGPLAVSTGVTLTVTTGGNLAII